MVSLVASARTAGASANALRRKGIVPCVVYGNVENATAECAESALKQAFAKAGESTLVELDIQGKKLPVLFHAVDLDPVSDRIIHVDFYAVDMAKEVETHVPLRFEGVSPAVKDLGGILVTPVTHVTVRCLPKDLPSALAVDLSTLATMHAVLSVKDLVLPQNITIVDQPDAVVATVQEPREEEVVEAPAATPSEGAAPAAEAGAAPAEGSAAPETAKKEKEKKE
jgi:large subunit ribosomal protein L25